MAETGRRLGVLSNARLDPRINWTTLGPPVADALANDHGASIISPPPLGRQHVGEWRDTWRELRGVDTLFWMQLSGRPETPLCTALAAAGPGRRSAYVIDAWPYSLRKIALFARGARLRPCFVAMREGFEQLVKMAPRVPFVHLPFGVDLDVFASSGEERDIFAFSMGRLHKPLHEALTSYCAQRGLTYRVSTGGGISDPKELGALVARSKYFVVTPPDLDHPERAGGFSPLVMRYLEGLAAGARLLGTLPRSGEFEAMVPVESILQVQPDGSDLARRLDDDVRDDAGAVATSVACDVVRSRHGWQHRAATIAATLGGFDGH